MKNFIYTIIAVLVIVVGTIIIGNRFDLSRYYPKFFGASKRPIPTGPDARTQNDFYSDMYEWLLKHTVESYKRVVPASQQDINAISFLDQSSHAMAFQVEQQTYQKLAAEGERIVSGGCTDPLVRLWYGLSK